MSTDTTSTTAADEPQKPPQDRGEVSIDLELAEALLKELQEAIKEYKNEVKIKAKLKESLAPNFLREENGTTIQRVTLRPGVNVEAKFRAAFDSLKNTPKCCTERTCPERCT